MFFTSQSVERGELKGNKAQEKPNKKERNLTMTSVLQSLEKLQDTRFPPPVRKQALLFLFLNLLQNAEASWIQLNTLTR